MLHPALTFVHRAARSTLLLTTTALAFAGCSGDDVEEIDPAKVEIIAAARAQQALIAPFGLRVTAPLIAPRLSDPAAYARVPLDAFCAQNNGCTADQLDRFPIFHLGQRLPLSQFEVFGAPGTVSVKLNRNIDGAVSTTTLNPTTTNALACDDLVLCSGGALDLQAVGRGVHELVFTLTAVDNDPEAIPLTRTSTFSYPLRVVSLADSAEIVSAWLQTAATTNIFRLSTVPAFTRARDQVAYARDVFEVNPIAAFALADDAALNLYTAGVDAFAVELDPAIDLLLRARFFAARAMVDTTIALRANPDEWDLLAGDEINRAAFPFSNDPRAFPVDEDLLLGGLQSASDGIDVVVDALTAKDLGDTAAIRANLEAGAFLTFNSDATIIGALDRGDEDYFRLENTTAAPIVVRAFTSTTCENYSNDPVVVHYNADGAFVNFNDDSAGGYCATLNISVPANGVAFVGVIDFGDNGATAYRLHLDFNNNGLTVTPPVDEVEPNDDGFVGVGGGLFGNDFTLAPGGGTSGLAVLRSEQLYGIGGTFERLIGVDGDAVPALRAAAMLDGDDVMATILGRATKTLSVTTRQRRIYANDVGLGLEPAYGRFVLASVRDAVNETLSLDDRTLLSGARTRLLSARNHLDTLAAAMAVFPEGFNTSPTPTGQTGANVKLISEVYLAAQLALRDLSAVQGSVIDTTAWQAGIAIGLNSVSRFSAFTGSRPLSSLSGDAVASFECRFGKTLLNLQEGDYAAANSLFSRSTCQLVDAYNEHYASGTLTDPLRIPDDGCIEPAEYNCPVSASFFTNGCRRVESSVVALGSLANDPGWTPSTYSNCGRGSIYQPQAVPFPSTHAFVVRNLAVEPEPYCVQFELAVAGPLSVATRGGCELGNGDPSLSLFGPGVDHALADRDGTGSFCEDLGVENAAAGLWVACVGNTSSTVDITDIAIEIAATRSCGAGTVDHDNNPITACEPCSVGEFCAGGSAPRVTCTQQQPFALDHDNNPATACQASDRFLAGRVFGNEFDNAGDGDLIYDDVGNMYALHSYGGTLPIGDVVLAQGTGGALVKYNAAREVQWIVNFEGPPPPGDNRLAAGRMAIGNGQIFVTGVAFGSRLQVRTITKENVVLQTTPVPGGAPYFMMSFDIASGLLRWQNSVGTNWIGNQHASVAVDAAGNPHVAIAIDRSTVVGATTIVPRGNLDGFIVPLSASTGAFGVPVQVSTGGNADNYVQGFTVLANGDYAVSGTLRGGALGTSGQIFGQALTTVALGGRGWVARISPTGVLRHLHATSTSTFRNGGFDFIQDLKPANDGGYYVAGRIVGTGATFGGRTFNVNNGIGGLVAHVDAAGAVAWAHAVEGNAPDPSNPANFHIRRLAVDDHSGVETVRFIMLAHTNNTFAGLTIPAPSIGPDRLFRDVTIDGATGATSLARIHAFETDRGGFNQLMSLAVDPTTGRAAMIGWVATTDFAIDNLGLPTRGGRDQAIVWLSH